MPWRERRDGSGGEGDGGDVGTRESKVQMGHDHTGGNSKPGRNVGSHTGGAFLIQGRISMDRV